MKVPVWAETKNGLIKIMSLSRETLEESMNIFRKQYFAEEYSCKAVELAKHPEAAVEVEELFFRAARDGISFIAVEESTQRVVGAMFNKFQVKSNSQVDYFKTYISKCRHESSRSLLQSMYETDSSVDLHKITRSECMLESMFGVTLPEFSGQGLQTLMMATLIKNAQALHFGKNTKVSIDNTYLPIGPLPSVIYGVATAVAMHKVMQNLGFKTISTLSFERFEYRGETFASRNGSGTHGMAIGYYRLKSSNLST